MRYGDSHKHLFLVPLGKDLTLKILEGAKEEVAGQGGEALHVAAEAGQGQLHQARVRGQGLN
jgi:hypothetical protein